MSPTQQSTADIVQLTAFRIGAEEYVVDIRRVREILRPVPITPVRRGPKYVEGVINVRGQVIPVVDMRRRLGLDAKASGDKQKIVVVVIDGRAIGLIVDSVTEVVRTPRSNIQPAPGFLDRERAPYFLGVCQHAGRTLILLNVKAIVASDEAIEPPTMDALMGDSP